MSANVEIVKTELSNGSIVCVEATSLGGDQLIGINLPAFNDISSAVAGVASSILSTLDEVKPRKAIIEFGIEVAIDSGKLTAIIVKGSGSANLKVTLEWGE
jgi:hypothetical protein